MRITQTLEQSQFVSAVTALESNLSQTQSQISSNLSFTTAAQNPTAAGAVNDYNQALAQSQQFDTNANSAQTNLSTEDNALSQVQGALQSLRDLALQANNGGLSSADLSSIGAQASQIQQSLLALANTQNGSGEYIFAGYASQTVPFTATAAGAVYNGDQGQRHVQIAAGQSVADGDNGDAVFNQIKTGNGTFAVVAAGANTGTGIIGATTVANPAAYGGDSYSIKFTSATAYEVDDATTGTTVSTGSFNSGQGITFAGLSVTLSGTPASGDAFDVSPSSKQSIFATVASLVTALQSGSASPGAQTKLNNSIGDAINNIDQALGQTSNVRADIGGRLNAITTQLSVSGSQQVQLQSSISSLQGLDYASAITTLDQQNTTLSAALQAYTLTQGLSLFKFLQ